MNVGIDIEKVTGLALNWAVAKALGLAPEIQDTGERFNPQVLNVVVPGVHGPFPRVFAPTTDATQAYDLILEYGISTCRSTVHEGGWWACTGDFLDEDTTGMSGESPFIAAMRCLLVNFADEDARQVEVPDCLVVAGVGN